MSSGSAALELVAPAHLWVPERAGSLGAEAVDLASGVGLDLSPEQRLVADVSLSVDAAGSRVALESALIEPRQNGKSWGEIAVMLAFLFLFARPGEHDLFVWTAHRYKTTIEAFRVFKQLIDGSAMLTRRVKRMPESVGDELIELHDGTRLTFLARQTVGGRGLAGRRVVLDEAFALTPAIMGSLFPIMSRQPDAQIRYASSAPLATSEVLHGIVGRGRRGNDPGLVYAEWSAPRDSCALGSDCTHALDVAGCALDDPELVGAANPEAGRPGGMSWEYLRSERRSFSTSPDMLAELVRERLGWEDTPASVDNGIDPARWESCADPLSEPLGQVHLALDVSKSFWSALAVAGERVDGSRHVEVIQFDRGTQWVPARVAELVARYGLDGVAVDPFGPVKGLLADLEAAGVTVLPMSSAEVSQACVGFAREVSEGSLRHLGEPVLSDAVRGASRRPLGDAWAWSRRNSAVDIAPLVAATLALWRASQAAPEPSAFFV